MHSTQSRLRSTAGILVALAVTGLESGRRATAEDLTFSGSGTVRILASDWAAYLGGSSTVDAGINDGGRLFWRSDRNAGDGQYIHFNLARLQGLTMQSTANVTLQNTNAIWGGSVNNSFIATANGAWTAANGAALPGSTAISDATNAMGDYGSGTSISWGIGSSTFQGYVSNASSFNGLAIIGGSGSQMHFDGPMNPYLTVTTNAAMNGVVTVAGGAPWNSGNYSFTDGVLTINDAVADGQSGAGNVTINALGTVFVNGNYNKYWAIDSTRINTGGVLLAYGHSHLHNLTLAGGELAGIRPDGTYGTWSFDDATTVSGGVTSTISAQQVNLDNGTFTIDAGSTLNFTGSIRAGVIAPTIAAGGRLVNGAAAGTSITLGAVTLNGGELAATSTPSSVLGNYVLGGTVSVGGSSMSTISADVRVINDQDRTFNVANADGGSGVDLLVSGKLGHYNGVSGGSFTKTGAGTMKTTGVVEVWRGTVNEGRLILEDTGIEGWWGGGLVTNAAVEFSASGPRTVGYVISGSGSVTKSGTGTLTITGDNRSSGGLVINQGTVVAARSPQDNGVSSLGSGNITINNGGTLYSAANWTTSSPWNGATVGSITVNNGGTWYINNLGQLLRNGLFLNGGTVSGPGENGDWGGLNLWSDVTAGGNAVSTVSVDTVLNTGRTITVDAGSQLNFSGKIHNQYQSTGAITKAGAGALVLSGPNTYTGQTDITAGTLVAANNTALGTGGHDGGTMSFIRDGATLALQGGVSLDEHFHVWGAGVGGLGAVRSLSGNNALTNSPGGSAGYALRSNTTVGVDADTLTVSGFYQADGNWGLTKVGAGTLVLTAVSDYAGGTTVNAGTLLLPNNGGFSRIRGALTVNAGATVETTGDGTGLGYNGQISAVAINGGTVTSAGTMHVWNITGGITMTGGTLQSNGGVSNPEGSQLEWNYTSVATNASASTATIGGRIRMRADSGYRGISFTVAEGAAATDLLVSAAITEASGGMGITKGGAGTMALSGTNNYSGVTTFEGGVINAATVANNGSASSLGVGTGDTDVDAIGLLFRGGTLQYTGSTAQSTNRAIRLSTTGGGGTIDASGSTPQATLSFTRSSSPNFFENPGNRTLTLTGVNTGANTFAMAIGEVGSTSVVKSGGGTWVLTGNNSYSGRTTINAGTLVADSVTALGNGGEIVFAGGTLRFTASSANQPWASRMKNSTTAAIAIDTDGQFVTLAGVIDDSNTAGLTKSGSGWLSLAGTNTYTGPTTVSAGILAVNGSLGSTAVSVANDAMLSGWGSIAGPVSVAAGGILAPGNSSASTLTIANTLTLANTSIIEFEINAADTTVGGGINDLITGVTSLVLGGTLNVGGGGDFTAVTPGTTWRLFDYSGTLTNNTLTIATAPTLTAGLSFVVNTSTANQVNLVVVPEPTSLPLAGLGLTAAAWLRFRRQRREA